MTVSIIRKTHFTWKIMKEKIPVCSQTNNNSDEQHLNLTDNLQEIDRFPRLGVYLLLRMFSKRNPS